MSGASAYLGMYFLCFLAVGGLVAVGAVLFFVGRRRDARTHVRSDTPPE